MEPEWISVNLCPLATILVIVVLLFLFVWSRHCCLDRTKDVLVDAYAAPLFMNKKGVRRFAQIFREEV